MRPLTWLIIGLLAVMGVAQSASAEADVDFVASLPLGDAAYAVAISPDGLLYVADIGGPRGWIFVFTQSGLLRERISIQAGPSGLVAPRAIVFDRLGNLYIADAASGEPERGRILRIKPRGRPSVYASGLTMPTALAVDSSGVLYVADGRNGAVLWIGPDGASASFVEDERLLPRTRSGVGASGLAFAPDESALYLTNFDDERLLRLTINPDGSAGRLSTLATSADFRGPGQRTGILDGPTGLAVDDQGNILVAAHRSNQIQSFTPRGHLLGRVPSSGGSLLANPTTLALADRRVYVANLGLEQGLSHVSRFWLSELYRDDGERGS